MGILQEDQAVCLLCCDVGSHWLGLGLLIHQNYKMVTVILGYHSCTDQWEFYRDFTSLCGCSNMAVTGGVLCLETKECAHQV